MRPSLCAEAMSSEGGDARSGHVPKSRPASQALFLQGGVESEGGALTHSASRQGRRPPLIRAKDKQIMLLKENRITGHLDCPKKAPERKSDVA